jgi:hypothetical protein
VAPLLLLVAFVGACSAPESDAAPSKGAPDSPQNGWIPAPGASYGDGGAAVSSVGGRAPKNGTRLKIRMTTSTITSADGAELSTTSGAGWFDTFRSEACEPTLAGDGKTRCLPKATGVVAFDDINCQHPVTIVSRAPCDDRPKYAMENVPPIAATCSSGITLYAVGQDMGPGGEQVFVKNGFDCVAVPRGEGNDVYALAKVADADFAEMTVTATTSP